MTHPSSVDCMQHVQLHEILDLILKIQFPPLASPQSPTDYRIKLAFGRVAVGSIIVEAAVKLPTRSTVNARPTSRAPRAGGSAPHQLHCSPNSPVRPACRPSAGRYRANDPSSAFTIAANRCSPLRKGKWRVNRAFDGGC